MQQVWEFLQGQTVANLLSLAGVLLTLVSVSLAAAEFIRRRRDQAGQETTSNVGIKDESTGSRITITTGDAEQTNIKDVRVRSGNIDVGTVETRRLRRSWWSEFFLPLLLFLLIAAAVLFLLALYLNSR